MRLADFDEFHVENEYGVGGDASGYALGAVALVRGDGQLGALALGHLGQALLQAGDHLSLSDLELEWLVPVPGGVNLLAVGQGKGVVTGHRLLGFGKGDAIARLEGLDFNAHFDKFKLDQKIKKSLINHRRRMISFKFLE